MFKVIRRNESLDLSQNGSTQRFTRLHAAPTLTVPRLNTTVFPRSMSYIGPNEWNGVPVPVRSLTDLVSFWKMRQRIDLEFMSLTYI